jgi:hypothetical protein
MPFMCLLISFQCFKPVEAIGENTDVVGIHLQTVHSLMPRRRPHERKTRLIRNGPLTEMAFVEVVHVLHVRISCHSA